MKNYALLILSIMLLSALPAFSQTDQPTTYMHAVKFYHTKDYSTAARLFDQLKTTECSTGKLYQGACIYALNNQPAKAFKLLHILANKKYYSNLAHLQADPDLNQLRKDRRWAGLVEKIELNSYTVQQRKLETIYTSLNKAKQLLHTDAGKLWGYQIWDDHLLVLDYDQTVYSLSPFPGSKAKQSNLYSAKVPANTVALVNTVQTYQGQDYATVLSNYLTDHSVTVIHELFHLLQAKQMKLRGDAIPYLDQYDARELLRLEYQALRNTLNSINNKERKPGDAKSNTTLYLQDALLFRKVRQQRYSKFLQTELEIETLEGLANYTGFRLSTSKNKLESAIEEIYQRENAGTYTRPFPYATGVAYGLIYDHLNIPWKTGLNHVYNFLTIYEHTKLIDTAANVMENAKQRSNYQMIHQEEEERRTKNESLVAYYRNLLEFKPTLTVMIGDNYGRTFNMNGTIEIPGAGTVYSSIQGRDKTGQNFGNFSTIDAKAALGNAGVLLLDDHKTLVFPTPFKVEGNKIIGETYEIELNDGWGVEKAGENFEIKQIKK